MFLFLYVQKLASTYARLLYKIAFFMCISRYPHARTHVSGNNKSKRKIFAPLEKKKEKIFSLFFQSKLSFSFVKERSESIIIVRESRTHL